MLRVRKIDKSKFNLGNLYFMLSLVEVVLVCIPALI